MKSNNTLHTILLFIILGLVAGIPTLSSKINRLEDKIDNMDVSEITLERIKLRTIEAEILYPNDTIKQQEYIEKYSKDRHR